MIKLVSVPEDIYLSIAKLIDGDDPEELCQNRAFRTAIAAAYKRGWVDLVELESQYLKKENNG